MLYLIKLWIVTCSVYVRQQPNPCLDVLECIFNFRQLAPPTGTIITVFLFPVRHNKADINAMLSTSQGRILAFISVSWWKSSWYWFPRRLSPLIIHMGCAVCHREWLVEIELLWQFVNVCGTDRLKMATGTARQQQAPPSHQSTGSKWPGGA